VVCLIPVLVLLTGSQCWRYIHAPNLSPSVSRAE
jgi:hypothetical protein